MSNPAELVRRMDGELIDGASVFGVEVWGAERSDGMWEGWLEFVPLGRGPRLRTQRETSQPNQTALSYWASGLEATYWDGAFQRAAPIE